MASLREQHHAQLRDALARVPESALTEEHRVSLDWLAGWDDRVVSGVCSLLRLAEIHTGHGDEAGGCRGAYDPHRRPGGGER